MSSTMRVVKDVSVALVRGLSDPRIPHSRRWVILGGFAASGLRFAAGMTVGKLGPRPQQRLVLWDFERCPYSRVVREALSALDLDVEVRPCPQGGTRFRPELQGGGVPRLVDPNTGETLVGSRTIVEHLYRRYGASPPPRLLGLPPVVMATGVMARFLTGQRGAVARPSRAPDTLAKGSKKRKAFVAEAGKMQVPYLVDPNTGARLFESLAIEQYLEATYGAGAA